CVLKCLGEHVNIGLLIASSTPPTCPETISLVNCTYHDCAVAAWNGLECVIDPLQALSCGVNETDVELPFVARAIPGEEEEEEDGDGSENDNILGGSAATKGLLMGGMSGTGAAIVGVVGGMMGYWEAF
ncbi:hypothetical protein TrRE_jg1405, partial [Triparma retinervis]